MRGTAKQPRLRRELSVWEALGVSLGVSLGFMAPSAAVNINPQAAAGAVGRAVPLASTSRYRTGTSSTSAAGPG